MHHHVPYIYMLIVPVMIFIFAVLPAIIMTRAGINRDDR